MSSLSLSPEPEMQAWVCFLRGADRALHPDPGGAARPAERCPGQPLLRVGGGAGRQGAQSHRRATQELQGERFEITQTLTPTLHFKVFCEIETWVSIKEHPYVGLNISFWWHLFTPFFFWGTFGVSWGLNQTSLSCLFWLLLLATTSPQDFVSFIKSL